METISKITKEQAAIISAFTGVLCCEFSLVHEYAERILGRPIMTHEFADPEVSDEIRDASREDFMRILPKQSGGE